MTNYEKDIAICEAASDGPWFVANWTDEAGHYFVEDGRQEGLYPIRCEGNEARYIAHFNPTYVRELLEARKERDKLRVLLKEAKCPCCDGSGAYYDNSGDVCQCQWCYEAKELLKDE